MQNITSATGLKNAIQLLEVEQADKGTQLKEQFYLTYDSFKPVNLLRSTLDDITSSPYLIDNILGTAMGLATGFISKKIFIGASGNKFRKLIGYILQFGVTNFVAQHPDTIKSLGQFVFQYFLRKKQRTLKDRDR
jgi:hypothetical protein